MASNAASDGSDAPTPFSRAELASEAERRWTPEYARTHRLKRSVSWLIASVLATYVAFNVFKLDTHDALFGRLILGYVAAYLPLGLIGQAASSRLQGDRLLGLWAVAWLFLICDAAWGITILDSGKYTIGISYISAALGVGGVLCYGLYIPPDPSVDWDAVFIEQLRLVRTARGGRSYEKIITDYRKAEEIAASWLRRFGYRDAHVTPDRQDDGIDVESFGAVAQVKNWTTKRAGIAEVQRLVGSAKHGQACFFFAAIGYTRSAARWAANPDSRVGLFILTPDGNIHACNYRARRTLWEAKTHLPVALRRPLTFRDRFFGSLFMFLSSILFVYMAIYFAILAGWVLAPIFGLMAICTLGVAAELAGRPIARIIKNVKNHRPLDIRRSFTQEVSREDEGLPSDNFVGYEPSPTLRLFGIIFDLGVQCRTIGRVLRARKR